MTRSKITIAAIAAALALAGTAQAGSAYQEKTQTVDLAGLDLSSEQGAEVAMTRIRNAARTVCDSHSSARSLTERNIVSACVDSAIETAVKALDSKTSIQTASADQRG